MSYSVINQDGVHLCDIPLNVYQVIRRQSLSALLALLGAELEFVNDIISRFRICCFRYQHRTNILHHEPSHHKRFKSFEVAVIRQIVRIRKIRRPLSRRSLSLQTVDRQLRIYPVQLAADRQRMIRQKIPQHTFRRLCSISLHPAFYQPLRYE